jgi:type VI secretion system protein ImpL
MHMVGSTAGSQTMLASRTNVMAQAAAAASNATTILRQEDLPAMPGWESGTQIQATESRKIPQWIFLSHIFSHIILEDHSALGVSGGSSRSDLWRRILLAGAGVLLLIWILGSTVSYFSNRALERDDLVSARSLPSATAGSQQLGMEPLEQLEGLRKQLLSLQTYAKAGAPLHLRWGLYSGNDIYPEVRRIYFDHFRALMFGQIQASIIDVLRRLPATPGPNDEYGSNYDALKAYLITTSNADKSTPEFLSPVLQRYLAGSQTLDANVVAVARAQFDFYATELKIQNPYSTVPDSAARDQARAYLGRFGAVPRIYAAMQNAASRQVQAVNFYRDHPDATHVLRSVPEVPGVFSKAGWDFMQNAIAHSDQYFHGEEWVLGGTSEAVANRADLEAQIRSMYEADYIARWQDFLRSTKVAAPYASIDDGTRKLKKLSTNESSLLQLLCYASLNTAGRSQQIDKGFKPVQQVVPPACENRLITPLTTPYVAGLADLESCFEGVTAAPQEQKDAQRQQCNSSATKAKQVVAEQIVPAMDVDPQGHINQTVQRLLEEPIAVPAPPPPHGGDAKGLCDVFGRMATKYPFNSYNDAQDVTPQEFDEFFRPGDGVLAKFIQSNQSVLVSQGAQYALKPGTQANWGPTFLPFLSRAHSIQQAFYPAGVVQPQYKFNVRAVLPEGGITGVSFTLNGQALHYPGASQTAAFVWPGSGTQEARISYRAGGGQDTDLLSEPGPWAMVRILTVPDARVTSSGSTLSAEWHPLQADRRTPLMLTGTGRPIIVHLEFDGGGAPFVFQSGTFSNLICRAAR